MIDRWGSPLVVPKLIRFLPYFVKLVFRLLRDRRVPFYLKLLPLGALIYGIAPLDFLPEALVPLLGGLDDLFVIVLACWMFLRLSPRDVVMEHGRRIGQEHHRR